MSVVAAAVVGTGLATAAIGAKSAKSAARAQSRSADAGIAEQARQFDYIRELLDPWVSRGEDALGAQASLLGLKGPTNQKRAISALQASPQFQTMLEQGEDSILSHAAATGGLRGGNVQQALGQFSPALLAATINDQYARLGGLSSMGLNAAGGTGQFAQASTGNITALLQQQGQAQAGAALAGGNAAIAGVNSIGSGLGYLATRPGGIGMAAPGAGVVAGGTGLNGSLAPAVSSPYSLVGGRF